MFKIGDKVTLDNLSKGSMLYNRLEAEGLINGVIKHIGAFDIYIIWSNLDESIKKQYGHSINNIIYRNNTLIIYCDE